MYLTKIGAIIEITTNEMIVNLKKALSKTTFTSYFEFVKILEKLFLI